MIHVLDDRVIERRVVALEGQAVSHSVCSAEHPRSHLYHRRYRGSYLRKLRSELHHGTRQQPVFRKPLVENGISGYECGVCVTKVGSSSHQGGSWFVWAQDHSVKVAP